MGKTYDIVIIGAGPGGYVSAIRAAQLGLSVALVERRELGGTCLNRGCIPTKTLLHAAHIYSDMRHGEPWGIIAEAVSFDMEKVYARKGEVVARLRDGVAYLLKAYPDNIQVIKGGAVIHSADTVWVDTESGERRLTTKNILIATGAEPVLPPIPGLDLPGVITSDEILAQPGTAYQKLTIIGGGVIGVEFATLYNALGCEVTLIEAANRILPPVDREISQNLSMILKKRGLTLHTGATVERVEWRNGGLVCCFTQKGTAYETESEAVLVAIGRRAYTEGLFAPGFSVASERGGLVTNADFQTSVPGVYAIGDVVAGGIQLAHAASAQGIRVVTQIAGQAPETDLTVVPSCIYTDPEIACVGITAEQAKALGIAVKTGKFNMTGLGKSVIEDRERSFAKLVFDADTGVLLGAQLMCARATDLIGELAVAVAHKLTAAQLGSVIKPHPSFTEGLAEAAEDALGRAIHTAPRGAVGGVAR